MKSKLYILVLFHLLVCLQTYAQWNDNWRDHFSYRDCQHIAESESFVVASAEIGVIVYDKSTGLSSTISKINGLSDVDISAIASLVDDLFIIGYTNGNIDIINKGQIINIPDLKSKQIQGSKRINHITQEENKVYCSVDFGILVINIDKLEISDTYYLGINSARLRVNECYIQNNYIYASTERGLLRAETDDPQIAYFEAWTNIGNSNTEFYSTKGFKDQLLTVRRIGTNPYELYFGDENNWQLLSSVSDFKNLSTHANGYLLAETNKIKVYNSSFDLIETINEYKIEDGNSSSINLGEAIFSDKLQLYLLADKTEGLVIKGLTQDEFILPNGPYSNSAFRLHPTSYGVYSIAGGLTTGYNNLNKNIEFSLFEDGNWDFYRSAKTGDERLWRDLIGICSDQINDRKVYMSTWGSGIFEIEGTTILNHYDQYNSGLQNIDWAGPNYVRVGGIASDSEGNLWMSNSEVEYGIVMREGVDTTIWNQFSYETPHDLHSTGQIVITADDYVWVIIPHTNRKGIFIVNTNNTLTDESDDQYRGPIHPASETDNRNEGQLRIWDESLNVITSTVYTIAEDNNGYIWLGTDKGVVVYYRPWAIFSDEYPIASRIKVPRNDGTNEADYLLEKEQVTCIAVDGANRKWLGTESSGLYLVSHDGIKTYQTFNMDNSPLPSNNISSLAIDPNTGEVFIGTNKGIVSYKGKATEGADNLNKIYAYPNPVREDFTGDITITGLVQNSNIKITNVSGRLVHETRSLGGKAYWDGRNLQGESVKSGVYIIYVSSEDGSQVESTKLLIVR